jgi:hypothetical protein
MINNKTDQEYRIKQFIELGSENSLTLDNTSLLTETQGVTFPTYNILRQKYRGIILENSLQIELDDNLLNYYKYKPKLLSLKLYNTTELWHLLLWLNNMTSIMQFSQKKMVVFNPDAMDVLNKIIQRESDLILLNHDNPDVVVNSDKVIRR